jgi:hypothetical protein
MTATARHVEEAELDDEGWKRIRQHSSSSSGVRSSSGGPTRRCCLRPVARRRCRRRQTRARGRGRWCLGGSWERGEFARLIGGGFYRPERRGQGHPVGGRRRLCWRRARATPASTALLACWRVVVSATECCGSVLARARWSGAC